MFGKLIDLVARFLNKPRKAVLGVVLLALTSCASLPSEIPRSPADVEKVADGLDDALAVASKAHAFAQMNEPAVCSEPSDACDHLHAALPRVGVAIAKAQAEVAKYRRVGVGALKAAEAVQAALREVRALAE